jgi:hypothetical protein
MPVAAKACRSKAEWLIVAPFAQTVKEKFFNLAP